MTTQTTDAAGALHGVDSKTAYDEWHGLREVDTEADSPWHLLIRENLDPARDLEGRSVLEIGCGRGGFSCWLARQANLGEQLAVDYSTRAVEMGREHAVRVGLDRIQWEHGDIQAIARPDSSFDTVFSCETIEHVPNPPKAVRELARVLKPGGRLFLTTPSYLNLLGAYRAYLWACGRTFTEVGQPINQLTMLPRTLKWVLEAGLRIERVDAFGHYVPFPGRPPIRVRLLDRARPLTRWVGMHSLIVARKR